MISVQNIGYHLFKEDILSYWENITTQIHFSEWGDFTLFLSFSLYIDLYKTFCIVILITAICVCSNIIMDKLRK